MAVRKDYETVRLRKPVVNKMRRVRDELNAKKAGDGGRWTIEGVILGAFRDAKTYMLGAEELASRLQSAADDYAASINAAMHIVAMDCAARREGVRRIQNGMAKAEAFDVDHVAHWRTMNAEQKASELAVARVRIESTAGVNPLAPMRSLAEATAWMADNPPTGMARDNAEANRRMRERFQAMAHEPPQITKAAEAAAKKNDNPDLSFSTDRK